MTDPASGSAPELRHPVRELLEYALDLMKDHDDCDGCKLFVEQTEAELEAAIRAVSEPPVKLTRRAEDWKRIGEQVQRLSVKAQQAQEPRCESCGGTRLLLTWGKTESGTREARFVPCVACEGES